jgi:hypothetical protein
MLDVRFFKNPRFSAASSAIALVFFSMFGSLFLLTQYLQFVLGYTPLEAGVRMLPFAAVMMVTAPSSARVVQRFGSKVTISVGLCLAAISLLLTIQLDAGSSYGAIAWRLMLMALGLGLTMAPATDSVMGSLPLAKAGVGSAVNDTTRQIGGALGVAVIGSVLASTYGSAIGDFLSGTGAPPDAIEAAEGSIGGAFAVAENLQTLPVPNATDAAQALISTANDAFVDAMHWGLLVAAISTFIGALVVAVFLPARAEHAGPSPADAPASGHPDVPQPAEAGT